MFKRNPYAVSPVARYKRWAQYLVNSGQALCFRDAARLIHAADSQLVSVVLDTIGSWPSSEPELRALQTYVTA